jgi:hypothetical protein
MVSYATPGGTITLDANLDDWHEVSALNVLAANVLYLGIQNISLYATTSDTHFVFAFDAGGHFGGLENYKASLLFDADLDTATGSPFFGGLNESLILSANSGCQCQSGEACDARLGAWPTVEPVHDP